MNGITIDGVKLSHILKEQGIVAVPDNCSKLILVDDNGKPITNETVNEKQITEGDTRYNVPKQEPTVPEEVITHTIETNDIYSKAKEIILNAQRRQVAYGIQKYPEPLNANSWSAVEAIDHILEESIDQIHYLVMLREKILNEPQVPYLDMRKMMEKARNRKG